MSPLLVAYTVEILPFRIRAKGLVIMNLAVNITLVFNQYVNPVALEKIEWKYYIVYCAFLAFEVVFIYFYLVETFRQPSLEAIAAIFDGEDKVEALHERTVEELSHDAQFDEKKNAGDVDHFEHKHSTLA
jgi:MFS family permease